MKKTVLTTLASAALILAATACGKHSWKETQVLHEGMHKGHGDAHGDAHGTAKPDAHGEKPAAHAPEHKTEAKH